MMNSFRIVLALLLSLFIANPVEAMGNERLSFDSFTQDEYVDFSMRYASNIYQEELEEVWGNPGGIMRFLGYLRANATNAPRFYEMVANLARKLNMTAPGICIFQGNILSSIFEHCGIDAKCNAFAYGFNGCGLILIGEDLIKGLSDAELEAVVAYELGHIYNNHIPKKVIFASILGFLTEMAIASLLSNSEIVDFSQLLLYVDYILSGTLGAVGANWLSRRYEKEADLTAAEIIDEPGSLTRALYKMQIIFQEKVHLIKDWLDTVSSTHPLTKSRKEYLTQAALQKATRLNVA